MKPMRGYYCLIQFCPDPSRAEAVNLGMLLFCPDAKFIAARTSAGNLAAAKLVGKGGIDKQSLNAAKRAIQRRLQTDREAFQTLEDLQKFVDSRANILKLTQPRPVKVFDPEQNLANLFKELVGGRPRSTSPRILLPNLDSLFRRLASEGRGRRFDWSVRIPILDRDLRVPYAYRNGDWNLVIPRLFPSEESRAVGIAQQLAIDGDLLRRYSNNGNGRKQLVVVSKFEVADDTVAETENRILRLFREYSVKSVPEGNIEEFAAAVDREARQ